MIFTPWKKWFAWRPVKTVGKKWMWFKIIYRCRSQVILVDKLDYTWAFKPHTYYGELFDVLGWGNNGRN
jgi:hypothetical protein